MITIYCSRSEVGFFSALYAVYSEKADCNCIFVNTTSEYKDMINIIEDEETLLKGKITVAKFLGLKSISQVHNALKSKNKSAYDIAFAYIKPFMLGKTPDEETSTLFKTL